MENGNFLAEILEGKETVAIGGHVRPDGDCIGSCTALYLYLQDQFPNIKTDVYLEDIPEKYQMIKGTDKIKNEIDSDMRHDIFICLDCAKKSRLGFSLPLFENAKTTASIDHHIANKGYADVNYIFPQKSSTSELIFDLLDKGKISIPIAEALFMGIAHDTGIFRYPCTSPKTMEAAAHLMRKGARASEIIEETFYDRTYMQNRLLGKILYESRLLLDGKLIVSLLEKEDMDRFGASEADMDGTVRYLRQTKGPVAALLIYAAREANNSEKAERIYRLSLRAKEGVDVNAVAQALGGGGHTRAAGATVAGEAEVIIEKVCALIKEQLRQAEVCE